MAVFNTDYYKNEDLYSDGDIEETLLEIVTGKTIPSDLKQIEYPIIYHLSNVRDNILNWYPFAEDSKVLEIGSGCGAITGMLCSKAKKVVSVELSKRRALINYERNKNADNLEIFVGNLNDMTFEDKFDYIVLNGVFEYAINFTDSKTPYETFLLNIKRFLSENGKVIIAIENKYGLKYFAGASEDHTNQYFLGLNGYEGNNSVRTFGKNELTCLLERSGFRFTKFYYPYPDYKFPNEIFTDDSFKSNGYGRDYYNLNSDRYILFNEEKVARGLVDEGVMSTFANSFLVIASEKEIVEEEDISYVKINSDRAEEFRILTKIYTKNEKKYVSKLPLCNEASNHIKKMIGRKVCSNENLKCVISNCEEGEFTYNYIESNTLNSELKELIYDENVDVIVKKLQMFFNVAFRNASQELFFNAEFQNVFGDFTCECSDECINNANIDLICDNIFIVNNEYRVIDSEWIFDFPIPVKFIIWRTLNELYNKYSKLKEITGEKDLFERFGIDVNHKECYTKWNYHFSKNFVGSDVLERFSNSKDVISLEDLMDNKASVRRTHSYLYVDDGQGFAEDKKIESVLKVQETEFKVYFDLSKMSNVKSLRWDPLENRLIKIKINKVDTNAKVNIIPVNGNVDGQGFIRFITGDPKFLINLEDCDIDYLYIEGNLSVLSDDELENSVNSLKQIIKSIGKTIENREWEISSNENLEDKLRKIEKYNLQMEELKEIKKYTQILSEEYSNLEERYEHLTVEKDMLLHTIKKLQRECEEQTRASIKKDDIIKKLALS